MPRGAHQQDESNFMKFSFGVKWGMDYSLKTISIASSGGDLPFEGLRGCFFQAN